MGIKNKYLFFYKIFIFYIFIFFLCQKSWSIINYQYIPIERNFQVNNLDFFIHVLYFKTDKNFLPSGNIFESLPDGNYFDYRWLNFKSRYVFNPKIGVFSSLGYAMVESFDGINIRQNNGFNDFVLGIDYNLFSNDWKIIPQILFIFPFNNDVSADTDESLIGEGATSFEVGVLLNKKINNFLLLHSYLSGRFRDQNRSTLLIASAGTKLYLKNNFAINFNLQGFESIINDAFVDNPSERFQVTDRVNGSSLIFYSVNPSYLEINGDLDFKINDNLKFSLGISYPIVGENFAYGMKLYSFLIFNIWSNKTLLNKDLKKVKRYKIKYKKQRTKKDQLLDDFEGIDEEMNE